MSKSLFIAEKPSVAREFAKALKEKMASNDGYMESEHYIVTWCVGHLVTMSYPEKYDEKFKRWSFETLPFLPKEFKYEVISGVKKQFNIVKGLLHREDLVTIFVCTDSGREGEYIYRLVAMMAGVPDRVKQKRVWIDSQTEEEILRGIKEAKMIDAYDNLSDAAYLRAKEDYLMGINFSRALSLKYSYEISNYLGKKYQAVSVGRVMTCVLGMVVRREREIRNFVKTPFYRVVAGLDYEGHGFEAEWKAVEGSRYFQSPKLYKENGFKVREDAQKLIEFLKEGSPVEALVEKVEKKTEKKNPPMLFNLAELQNECSKRFKISPDRTLQIVQELYEKKLVTYPRTDARVLSTAISKEIGRNIKGLTNYRNVAGLAAELLEKGTYKNIAKTKYVNDAQITDHYAIIPTGQGLNGLGRLEPISRQVYDLITRRFLAIFYPAAVYKKINLTLERNGERLFAGFRILEDPGYLKVYGQGRNDAEKVNAHPAEAKTDANADTAGVSRAENTGLDHNGKGFSDPSGMQGKGTENRPNLRTYADMEDSGNKSGEINGDGEKNQPADAELLELLNKLRKGKKLPIRSFRIKEGETSPPKRYTSGSMILAMENAGQLIEDEELRAQIKGSGIGTSATRAEILKKLVNIKYLSLNKKTQVITPTQMGEMVHDVVYASIRSLLNPELTASWEKGLTYVAKGDISSEEYMQKLEAFVAKHTGNVRGLQNQSALRRCFDESAKYYRSAGGKGTASKAAGKGSGIDGSASGARPASKAVGKSAAGKSATGRKRRTKAEVIAE